MAASSGSLPPESGWPSFGNDDLLGVSAAGQKAPSRAADLQRRNLFAGGQNFTGAFESGNVRLASGG
jgi:hypothetical protein